MWLKRRERAGPLAVTDVHHRGTERTEDSQRILIILLPNRYSEEPLLKLHPKISTSRPPTGPQLQSIIESDLDVRPIAEGLFPGAAASA
jgi:hypothetical protein